MILFHVHDDRVQPLPSRTIGNGWTVVAVELERLADWPSRTRRDLLLDVDLGVLAKALAVKAALRQHGDTRLRVFACGRTDRHAIIQAGALGATTIVDRPVSDDALAALLPAADEGVPDAEPASAAVGRIALAAAFESFTSGARLAVERFAHASVDIARDVDATGIAGWLGPIRRHHLGTYQHCLTVTGLAAAFGQALGLSARDLSDLTVAALLHDIGKARISPAVLDKPGALDRHEMALVRNHPAWGEAYLLSRSDVAPAICAAVRHHHEYLDGSGYPDGLAGAAIGDLTRLVTVVDVFAALVEARAYKPPLPAGQAMAVLRGMVAAGRLEGALVEAFGVVAAQVPIG